MSSKSQRRIRKFRKDITVAAQENLIISQLQKQLNKLIWKTSKAKRDKD